MVRAGERAVVEDGRRVEDVVALVDVAHDRGEPSAVPRHLLERPQVRFDEGGLEEQVLRGVAGHHQLREGHEVAAERAGAVHAGDHQPGVGLDRSDRRIHLGQPHPHPPHVGILL